MHRLEPFFPSATRPVKQLGAHIDELSSLERGTQNARLALKWPFRPQRHPRNRRN